MLCMSVNSPLELVLYCYINMPTILRTCFYLILSWTCIWLIPGVFYHTIHGYLPIKFLSSFYFNFIKFWYFKQTHYVVVLVLYCFTMYLPYKERQLSIAFIMIRKFKACCMSYLPGNCATNEWTNTYTIVGK